MIRTLIVRVFPLFFLLEYDTLIKVRKWNVKQKRTKGGTVMDYMKYITIQVIKKSERSEVVFAAMDEMDVPVVVKRLQGANPEIYRGIAKLRNSHIPRIYCVEEQGEELCIAEEYIDGRTLDVYLAEETLTDLQKMELMVQLCEALEVLHQCNPPVIHRDIKPSNILITTDGVLKIIDFDASRQYKTEKNTSDTRLLGTVEYAAPEQFGYAQTDVRSDIYSAGVVFNEIKTEKDSSYAGGLKRLIDKCTSFDPENRYKNVTELKKDLLKCIERAKYPVWKRWLVPSMATGVLLLMLIAGAVQQHREKERAVSGDLQGTPTMQADKSPEQPTEEPQPTEVPLKFVTKPEEVSDWYIPTVRWGYIGENREYKVGKRLVGTRTEKAGYSCRNMKCADAYGVSWKLNDNDSIELSYHKIYDQLILELPEVIQMKYCNRMVVRAQNEVGKITVILYDEEREEIGQFDLGKTQGAQEVTFYPDCKWNAEYIGFMANDGELLDYSEFEAMLYYVDFYMLNSSSEKTTHYMAYLKERCFYDLTYKRNYKDDASINLTYNKVYGELQLKLPEPVDMKQCEGVSVVMDTGGNVFSIKLFDEDFDELDCAYDYRTDGMQEVLLDTYTKKKVYGIGLMIDEENPGDWTDDNDCEVTVKSISFYMKPGYKNES